MGPENGEKFVPRRELDARLDAIDRAVQNADETVLDVAQKARSHAESAERRVEAVRADLTGQIKQIARWQGQHAKKHELEEAQASGRKEVWEALGKRMTVLIGLGTAAITALVGLSQLAQLMGWV